MNNKKKLLKLRNGIKVLIVPTQTNLVDVSIYILLGESHENPNEMEVTHYLEHLMARFTSQKYKDYKYISKELNRRGAKSNASVDAYTTKFYIQGFYKDTEFFLDLLSNTIHKFYLEKSLVKQEKNAVIQELRGYMTHPTYVFNMKIWKYMYAKYAYQYDHKKHIKHIEKYDANKIYKFIDSHILLKNTIVSVSCPEANVEDTAKLIKKYFLFKPKAAEKQLKYPIYQYDNSILKVVYVSNKFYKDDNATIRIVVDGSIKYLSKEHLCLIYLQNILFDFDTGIFYTTLRNKLGLIYSIYMYLDVHLSNPILSSYFIQTSTNYKNVPLLINTLLDIISSLIINEENIKASQQKLSINFEFEKFTNLTSFNIYYSKYLLHKVPIVEKQLIQDKLQQIKPNDIKNILKKMQKELLEQGLIFYYAKKQMNTAVKKLLSTQRKEKIKYVTL
jgi:predicted Zn-dependent peptidase